MNWLAELARSIHDTLAPAFRAGLHPSHAMSGALAVVNAGGDTVLFQATANYNPDRGHVERQLMAALFSWTKDTLGTPFILPAGCTVYLYVYNSPCQECAKALALTLRLGDGWGRAANHTVTWRLGFSRYYTSGENSYPNSVVANQVYAQTLAPAGWVVAPVAPPAAAAAAPVAAAAAAGGGGGGAGGGGGSSSAAS